MTKQKDFSAVKFMVSETLGEWMNCLFLKGKDPNHFEYEHDFIHHTFGDGMTCIGELLKQEGFEIHSEPTLKENTTLSPLQKFLVLKKFLKLTAKSSLLWKKERRDCTGIPESFSLIVLNKQETLALEEKAKLLNVSLNSFLLWALDDAVKANLTLPNSDRKWVLPLNMRRAAETSEESVAGYPGLNRKITLGNHSASIILNLGPDEELTPKSIHQNIRSYLKGNLHYGSQIYSNMAKYIGQKGTLKVARKIKEIGTGVFTNVGAWPHPGISPQDSHYEWRAVVAPSTQVLPVAAATWKWKDCQSFTLQLHPSLNLPKEMAAKVIKSWINGVLELDLENHVKTIPWAHFKETPLEKVVTY